MIAGLYTIPIQQSYYEIGDTESTKCESMSTNNKYGKNISLAHYN